MSNKRRHDARVARKAAMPRRRFLQGIPALALAVSLPLPTRLWGQQDQAADRLAGEPVKALLFDIFGTVVDWHGSIVSEGQLLEAEMGLSVDWEAFASRWRAGYGPAMNQVRTGALPWTKLDALHRMILDGMVEEFGLGDLDEAELERINRIWHRLNPWPDSVAGLERLKSRYIIAPLSNGNVSMLLNIARHARLPWDTILSAELAEHYKPDPEAYLKAADLLDLSPRQIMLVAAHPSDLRAAANVGFRTAYIYRPLERGENNIVTRDTSGDFDLTADDLLDLARMLGT
jgi:2-haloacid dehalogenase